MIIIKVEEHHSKEGSKKSLFLLFELILGEDDGGRAQRHCYCIHPNKPGYIPAITSLL